MNLETRVGRTELDVRTLEDRVSELERRLAIESALRRHRRSIVERVVDAFDDVYPHRWRIALYASWAIIVALAVLVFTT